MLRRWAIVGLLGCFGAGSCATLASWFGSYDDRSIVIHTLDLFDQRQPPVGDYPDWKGDWIFRRERLSAADHYIRSEKPDVLVLQNAMARQGSPSESDTAILAAGALVGFEFSVQPFAFFEDTQEESSLAVATSLPVSIRKLTDPSIQQAWTIGQTGYMTLTVIENEGQPISLFNVKMPDERETSFTWYDFIYEKIYDHLTSGRFCAERLVIAGYLPYSLGSERLFQLFEKLNLQDVADEDCALDVECYTRSPRNALGSLVNPSAAAGRVDKLLVSNEALVYSSSRSFDETTAGSDYLKRWDLNQTWPSHRFGWSAEIKFPRCTPPQGNK